MTQSQIKTPRASIALIEFPTKQGTKILAMQRAINPKDPWSGHWSFPGGKIEPGETPFEAVLREVHEEVGIVLKEDQFTKDLGIYTAGNHVGREVHVQVFCFKIQEDPQITLDPGEVRQVHWILQKDFVNEEKHGHFATVADKPFLKFDGYPMPDRALWGFSYGVLLKHWPHR